MEERRVQEDVVLESKDGTQRKMLTLFVDGEIDHRWMFCCQTSQVWLGDGDREFDMEHWGAYETITGTKIQEMGYDRISIHHHKGCELMEKKHGLIDPKSFEPKSKDIVVKKSQHGYLIFVLVVAMVMSVIFGNAIFMGVPLGLAVMMFANSDMVANRIEAFRENRKKPEPPSFEELKEERRKEIRSHRRAELNSWEKQFDDMEAM